MDSAQAQYTANEVLHAFRHDAPYLFLGSAFITVGVVSVGYCFLRRKFERLLVWLAAFAALYGIRLWLKSHLMGLELHENELLSRIPYVLDFLVPIPGFTFLRVAGFGSRDRNKKIKNQNYIFILLAVLVLIFGPMSALYSINGLIITIYLWMLLFRSLGKRMKDRASNAVRIGVVSFVALALFDNTLGSHWNLWQTEPFGFAIMLGSFGYVAARRVLEREVELGEIQKELDLARSIQQSILPSSFPASKSFKVAACYKPMTSVAGDFYDFLVANDRQAGVLVADVSGHGIPAALIASMLKMAADSNRLRAAEPAALLQAMNSALHGSTRGEMVTAAYVYLDAESKEMRYSAAGHPAMLMLREGAVTEVVENGLPLAAAPFDSFRERRLEIRAGDRLLLYTDGLVEARNGAGEMFGEERLTAAFASSVHAATEEAAGAILAAVERWSAQQDDDRTVLVCDYLGTQAA